MNNRKSTILRTAHLMDLGQKLERKDFIGNDLLFDVRIRDDGLIAFIKRAVGLDDGRPQSPFERFPLLEVKSLDQQPGRGIALDPGRNDRFLVHPHFQFIVGDRRGLRLQIENVFVSFVVDFLHGVLFGWNRDTQESGC